MPLHKVREHLLDVDMLQHTMQLTTLDEKQINYILDFNEKYNNAIKK